MKFIILVCDGMADQPNEKGETPLSVARTPNFDAIATGGVTGLVDILEPGETPNSDTGHLSILGYDPAKYYAGRGPLEALGGGIPLQEGDVCFRTNFATIENGLIKDRRAGRPTGDLSSLENALNAIELPVEFKFHHTIGHRGFLVLRGADLSEKVTDADPHAVDVSIVEVKATDKIEASKNTAEIVNEFIEKAQAVLSQHEFNKGRELVVNAVLTRGAGIYKPVESFQEKYRLKGAGIAAVALVRGVISYLGLDLLKVEGMTGNEKTNVKNKFETAVNALQDHDFVLVNVKGTDNFGHDGNFKGKKDMIEKIDKELQILMKSGAAIAVLSDHATPCTLQNHSGDPVPIAIYGTKEKDAVQTYSEHACALGSLGRLRAVELIQWMQRLE